MFGPVAPTQYDLRFHVGPIPVRVHPMFWLLCFVFGQSWLSGPAPQALLFLAIWVAVMFVSILIHEFGHAWTARAYGQHPEIVLHGFGGQAVFLPGPGYTARRNLAVVAAGPGAGFLLYGAAITLQLWLGKLPAELRDTLLMRYVEVALMQLEYVNLAWSLFNLLPVYPLDGGQLLVTGFQARWPRGGWHLAMQISTVVAFAAAALAFWLHEQTGLYLVLLFAVLAAYNLQMLSQDRRW